MLQERLHKYLFFYIIKNESIRTEYLKQRGYDVYVIWEDEWRFNKTKVISEIQQYIS